MPIKEDIKRKNRIEYIKMADQKVVVLRRSLIEHSNYLIAIIFAIKPPQISSFIILYGIMVEQHLLILPTEV